MSIDKIYEENKQISYVFDIQSSIDQDATDSYILTKTKKDYTLKKIKDYKMIMISLKIYKAKRIKDNTKDCYKFGKALENSIKDYQYKSLFEEDENEDISPEEIQNIVTQYKTLLLEVKNKGPLL